jgi:hypothetical protein
MSTNEWRIYEAKRDSGYCLALLEQTGICVVPGSGFGQRARTFHFRTTFLPSRGEIKSLVEIRNLSQYPEPIAKPLQRPEGPEANRPDCEVGIRRVVATSAEGATLIRFFISIFY